MTDAVIKITDGWKSLVARHDDELAAISQWLTRLEADLVRLGALIRVHGDWLTQHDGRLAALEAAQANTEAPASDANPSEAHLQPNDSDRPAHVVYDAVTEIEEADIGESGTVVLLRGFIADKRLAGRYRITITEVPGQ